jgi:hypothetical protein
MAYDPRMVFRAGSGRSMIPAANDAEMIGEAMYPGMIDGTPITKGHIQSAQKRFLASGAEMVPLLPNMDPALIRKAIFEHGVTGDKTDEIQKALDKNYNQWMTETADTFWAELPDVCELKKAFTTSSNLMHVIADQDVTYLYKRPYPLQALIPTESNKGKTANFDIVGPYDFGSAFAGTEDQMFTESDMTTYNRSQYIKYMFAVLRVTKAAQLAGLAQVPARDMLAIRIDAAQDALRALRERMMLGVTLNVNDTTFAWRAASTSTDVNYNGLYQMIQANTAGTSGDQTWITSTGGDYDTIQKDLDTTYNTMVKFGMQPNLALCDYRVFGIMRRGLWEHFRTEPIKELATGISKISLVFPGADGLPLVPHPFMPQTAGSGTIMLVDTRLIARRSLWQDMYEDLAKINLSQKAVISAAETMVDKSDIDAASSLHGGVFSIA